MALITHPVPVDLLETARLSCKYLWFSMPIRSRAIVEYFDELLAARGTARAVRAPGVGEQRTSKPRKVNSGEQPSWWRSTFGCGKCPSGYETENAL